jgi:hypothetical protein
LTGKQRRKRSPPKCTGRKRPDVSKRTKALFADPVWKAKWMEAQKPALAYRKLHPEKFYRRGVPDGMRKPEADRLWAIADEKSRKFIRIMKDEGHLPEIVVPGSDEERAEAVLQEMVKITLSPLTHQPTKVSAGRTVLEWTKSKPVQKTAVAISNAEDWLNSVVSDNKASDATNLIEGPGGSTP